MSAQKEFDETYITSSEICRELDITRATIVTGKRRGLLPNPIKCEQLQLWRRDEVRPHLDAWKAQLQERREGSGA